LTAALVAVLALPATADDAPGTEKAVLEAQDERFAATIAADVTTLSRLLTDDMTYTHSSAVVETKAEFLEALRAGKYRYRSIAPEQREVRLYGDAAVVAGTCRVRVEVGGKDNDIRLRFTELYVRQGGAWRLALWHATRMP
jgi:ketosteroid isomerase-like protein